MISQGAWAISMSESLSFLKARKLFKGEGNFFKKNHSTDFIRISKENKHSEIYTAAIQNLDYEILLFDDSIFQFAMGERFLRYCFIQNPYKYVDIHDYLNSIYTPEELIELRQDEIELLISTVSENEYEQFRNEQDLDLQSHIIRYDFSDRGYTPLVHSCSHIHVGLNENLRIPCSRILTPLSFVIFCIKNTYYEDWKKSYDSNQTPSYLKGKKKLCKKLDSGYWQDIEEHELYIT